MKHLQHLKKKRGRLKKLYGLSTSFWPAASAENVYNANYGPPQAPNIFTFALILKVKRKITCWRGVAWRVQKEPATQKRSRRESNPASERQSPMFPLHHETSSVLA